jgi:hypothetical protein
MEDRRAWEPPDLAPIKPMGQFGSLLSSKQIGACLRWETFEAPFVVKDRRPIMTKLKEKARGQTKQIMGQIFGDELLVQEGKEQVRHAEKEKGSNSDLPVSQR